MVEQKEDLFAGIDNKISELKDPRPQVQEGTEDAADATTHLQNAEELLLNNEKTSQMFLSRLKKARNTSAEVGKIAGDIINETLKVNGVLNYQPNPEIIFGVAEHIVNMVYEFANAFGVYKSDGKGDKMPQQEAIDYALIRVVEKNPELFDPNMINQMISEIEGGRYDGAMNKPTGMLKPGQVPERNVPIPPPQEEPMPPQGGGGGGGMPPMMPPTGGMPA